MSTSFIVFAAAVVILLYWIGSGNSGELKSLALVPHDLCDSGHIVRWPFIPMI
jgi:hypothetical protein